jgi:hypothetical protein
MTLDVRVAPLVKGDNPRPDGETRRPCGSIAAAGAPDSGKLQRHTMGP